MKKCNKNAKKKIKKKSNVSKQPLINQSMHRLKTNVNLERIILVPAASKFHAGDCKILTTSSYRVKLHRLIHYAALFGLFFLLGIKRSQPGTQAYRSLVISRPIWASISKCSIIWVRGITRVLGISWLRSFGGWWGITDDVEEFR